ncbi:MAG: hypothetical protein QGD94_06655, partial [Planctomycetia bacterium]|nr:hypothetical protein [Planctomycetia bacterium]
MSLEQWYRNGWLKKHKSSPEEMGELFTIVERDMGDAKLEDSSPDMRLVVGYNAGRQLCMTALYASGFAPAGEARHYRTIASIVLTLGPGYGSTAETLDEFRKKRNRILYEQTHVATPADLGRLLSTVKKLTIDVKNWLKKNHPKLCEDVRILRTPPAPISGVPEDAGSGKRSAKRKAIG